NADGEAYVRIPREGLSASDRAVRPADQRDPKARLLEHLEEGGMGQLLHHQRRRRDGGGRAAGWQRPRRLWSRSSRADASREKSTRRGQALDLPALRGPRHDSLPGGRREENEARHNKGSRNRCRRLELSEDLSQSRRFAKPRRYLEVPRSGTNEGEEPCQS